MERLQFVFTGYTYVKKEQWDLFAVTYFQFILK